VSVVPLDDASWST